MKVKMELLSDAIFGNGMSVPGGEDISILHDNEGFPYFKGTTFKGIFREELEHLIEWAGYDLSADDMLGKSGSDNDQKKIVFSDFTIPAVVKKAVITEVGKEKTSEVLDVMTNLRTFTRINENGVADEGSLRIARCVNRGLVFYSEVGCSPDQEKTVEEVLALIKWIGTMRNRGFGKVSVTRLEG